MTSRFLCLAGLFGIAALGCTRATFQDIEGGAGTSGGASAGTGGHAGSGGGPGGTGGDGQGGGAGTANGGNGGGVAGAGGGTGGSIGSGGGGRGGTSAAGTAGGTAGTGAGGAAGTGSGGTAGTGGRGGTGVGGTGGVAGTGGGGRGGGGGTAGTGGSGGTPDGGVPVRPTVAGQIVVTELLHDVNGVENNGEWFEVYNPSATVIYDLMGCDIRDISPSTTPVVINAPLVLAPGAFRTLAISSSPGFTPDFVYGATIKFDNDAADRVTITCGGVEIDTFGYDSTDATDPTTTGHSFSVDPDHYSAIDNDVRANWCLGTTMYTTGNFGTPGAANPQCP